MTNKSPIDLSAPAFSFVSPFDGKDYAVDALCVHLMTRTSQLSVAMAHLFPASFAKAKAAEVAATIAKDGPAVVEARVALYKELLDRQAEKGTEHSVAKAIRYELGQVLAHVSEEELAVYHTIKTPGGEDSKTVATISAAALHAYEFLLKRSYVPGL